MSIDRAILLEMSAECTASEWAETFGVSRLDILRACDSLGVTCRREGAFDVLPARTRQIAELEARLLGWSVMYETTSCSWRARSPAYDTDGIVIEAATTDILVERVKSLIARR